MGKPRDVTKKTLDATENDEPLVFYGGEEVDVPSIPIPHDDIPKETPSASSVINPSSPTVLSDCNAVIAYLGSIGASNTKDPVLAGIYEDANNIVKAIVTKKDNTVEFKSHIKKVNDFLEKKYSTVNSLIELSYRANRRMEECGVLTIFSPSNKMLGISYEAAKRVAERQEKIALTSARSENFDTLCKLLHRTPLAVAQRSAPTPPTAATAPAAPKIPTADAGTPHNHEEKKRRKP